MQHSVTFHLRHSCHIWYSNLLQSRYIRQNSDRCISDFWISGQSLVKKNCHKSRTSNDNDMKLGPNLGKRNTEMSKYINDDVMPSNFDIIVIFPIYDQFGASQTYGWILDVWSLKLPFSLITFYFTRTENKTKKSQKCRHQ